MNPRDPFGSNGFQDRRFQPLTHSSAFDYNLQRRLRVFLVNRDWNPYNPRTLSSNCSHQNPNQNEEDGHQNDEHWPSKPLWGRHFAISGHDFSEALQKIFKSLNNAHICQRARSFRNSPTPLLHTHRFTPNIILRSPFGAFQISFPRCTCKLLKIHML